MYMHMIDNLLCTMSPYIHTAVAVGISFFINMFIVCAFGAVSHDHLFSLQ